MGHSVARDKGSLTEEVSKSLKRLELLPEEALYLLERGAMFCWKNADLTNPGNVDLEEMEGAPMSVQQAFAEMIGKEDLTLEGYQVRRIYAKSRQINFCAVGLCIPQEARVYCYAYQVAFRRISYCSSI
jgi:tRNA-splicing endonuclease subunit Sen54